MSARRPQPTRPGRFERPKDWENRQKWWRPSKINENLLAWLVVINGLVVDARNLPREIQEELARRGLIPFIPSEKKAKPKEMSR